ncbi:SPFH domain-containing protein [Haloarchaeobius iranensis]|uniref:Regulator of protease activity HflC, stomatin/prohibitin superfamily n=1 Tax=Haloarchaeobius iranensis TaxID=996166 RepID=A0A1G9WZM0_9EURY|nr:SPFH domain-containing protein [Haloarchaeobius iranensis]SDM89897.1 Regulator of protease activity HflC, stomatin/prohibitin superfamily [Haloarchaeobius iranensis]
MEPTPLQTLPALGFVFAIIGILIIVALASAVKIVQPTEKRTLTVLGQYRGLLEPGIHFVPPFVSSTVSFDMRTQTLDVPPQEAITRDNSPVVADAVVYIRVMDAGKAFLEVEDYKNAVENLAQTTLRAVIGDMELDDTLNKRQEINARIREELDEPTDEWGVRVESVEVREVNPSKDVQQAMEQQTSAERRRRAMILEAQGERRSAVEKAEGDKQSEIIRAQGQKQSQILEAQGDAISTVLRAKSAESMGERAVIDKGLEALEHIGTSESTTFVLPQELSSMLGRYGKHLTGSDIKQSESDLSSQDFDAETREMLGLDDIEEIIGQIDEEAEMDVEKMEQQAEAVKQGQDPRQIKSSDEVIDEADDEFTGGDYDVEQDMGDDEELTETE